jgi:hypothetical protein
MNWPNDFGHFNRALYSATNYMSSLCNQVKGRNLIKPQSISQRRILLRSSAKNNTWRSSSEIER